MQKKFEWGFMIAGMVTTIITAAVFAVDGKEYTWPIIAAMWIGVCMLKQGTIDMLEKRVQEVVEDLEKS